MVVCLLAVTDRELGFILNDSAELTSILEEKEESIDDLDKSWEGLIYLLSGHPLQDTTGPVTDLSRVIFSGQVVDENQDLGMGPAHYLNPAQVSVAAKGLALINPALLQSHYDP